MWCICLPHWEWLSLLFRTFSSFLVSKTQNLSVSFVAFRQFILLLDDRLFNVFVSTLFSLNVLCSIVLILTTYSVLQARIIRFPCKYYNYFYTISMFFAYFYVYFLQNNYGYYNFYLLLGQRFFDCFAQMSFVLWFCWFE